MTTDEISPGCWLLWTVDYFQTISTIKTIGIPGRMLCLRLTWTSRLQCSFVPWCSRGKRAEANERQTDNETYNQQQIRIGNVTKTSWIWRQPTQQNIEQVSKLYPRDAMLAWLVLSCLDNCYKPRTEYHTNETGSLHTRSVPVASHVLNKWLFEGVQ